MFYHQILHVCTYVSSVKYLHICIIITLPFDLLLVDSLVTAFHILCDEKGSRVNRINGFSPITKPQTFNPFHTDNESTKNFT